MTAESQRAGPSGDRGLLRAVGVLALTAAVMNVIIGGGIFRLPASIATQLGPAAPTAFLVGAIAIVPIMLCFAAAGSRVASTGGPYAYMTAAFGPFPGFLTGALLWICNLSSSAGVAVALSEQASQVFPAVATTGGRSAFLVGVYALLVALNAFGIKLGARAIVLLATLKLTPLVLLSAIGLFFVDWGQVQWTAVPSWHALGATMVMVMFAYSGAETALTPAGEVRDPARDVPRATLAALLIVVLVYVSIQVVAQGVMGPDLAGNKAPIAATAGRLWSPGFGLLLATASISMFGFLMGNLLGSSRVAYALGRDGYLPQPVGRITERYRVPLIAIILHGSIACGLALWGSFEFLVKVSGGANCLLYVAVAVAAWRLQQAGRAEHGKPFALPGGAVLVPALASLGMVAILTTLTPGEWGAIGAALAILVLLYAALEFRRRGIRPAA